MPLIVNGTTVKHVNVIKDGVTTSLKQIKMSDGTVVFNSKVPLSIKLKYHWFDATGVPGGACYFLLDCEATIPKGSGATILVVENNFGLLPMIHLFDENNLTYMFKNSSSTPSGVKKAIGTITTSFDDKADYNMGFADETKVFNFPAD